MSAFPTSLSWIEMQGSAGRRGDGVRGLMEVRNGCRHDGLGWMGCDVSKRPEALIRPSTDIGTVPLGLPHHKGENLCRLEIVAVAGVCSRGRMGNAPKRGHSPTSGKPEAWHKAVP